MEIKNEIKEQRVTFYSSKRTEELYYSTFEERKPVVDSKKIVMYLKNSVSVIYDIIKIIRRVI